MKIIFSILCLSVIPACLFAQSNPGYLGNYTQPAPNAASLGKYVDYPVGYYTGTPEISIPIFELKDGAAKLPVSLSYHASGIRVSEIASWVGLGWNLNATGMIIRTVRGAPDEGYYGDHVSPGGYYQDYGITKLNKFPYPTNGVIIPTDSNTSIRDQFLYYAAGGRFDGEPDLFTFNFNGYSGKFVFDENRTPRLLGQQDLKIAVSYGTGGFLSWIITTPDGADYYFGENNMHEVTAVFSSNSGDDANTHVPSSWYLTKIIYPNTKDTVLFNYTPETYWYFDLGIESVTYAGANNGSNNDPHGACVAATTAPMISYKTTVSGLRLTSIQSRNYTISFKANNIRQDVLSASSNPYTLDSIKIFNSTGQCIKQYYLSHSYFTSTTATGASAGALSLVNGDVSDTKRLKLVSVQEFSGDGALSKPPYNLTYQETYQLPRRMSYDQDHWGFSNNYAGSYNDRFTPKVVHSICTVITGRFANRDPKWPDMQAFSIKSITDPLGVLTSFEFESHTSTLMLPNNVVGGLRIHKIKTVDGVTGDSTIRLYDYGNGGVLYKVPQYLIELHNEYYYPNWPQTVSYTGYNFSEFQTMRGLIRQSQSIVPLQDFQGNHIGYPGVKEIFGPHGEGGYKEYSFMSDQLMTSSRLSIDNYTATASIQNGGYGGQGIATGIYGNGKFNDILPINLTYYNDYGRYYPYAPPQVDFRRGQLLNQEAYDSSGNLLQSVFNVYKQSYDETNWIRGFKFHRVTINFPGGGSVLPSSLNYDAFTFYKLHTGISHLVQTVTKDYKDGKTFTSTTNIGYESAYHTLQTSDTTVNSQGDSIINKTYYSFDYANSATSDNVFAKMKARNMLSPVSRRVWKNNKLVSGSITQYKDFASLSTDTLIHPQKIYSLDLSAPLTTSQAGESIKMTGLWPTLVPSSYYTEKADFNYNGTTGKITEQNLVNDKKQALIWDNNASLPLAIVDNASVADVGYSNFETAETGNYTYTAGSVITDATSPFGSKVYTLGSSAPISKSGLTVSKQYIISVWLKSGGSVSISGATVNSTTTGTTLNSSWQYKQFAVTTTATSVSITGSGYVDEVRLYPANAQMTSYTYDALYRPIIQCGINSTVSYYDYDTFSRVIDIKDQYGNILKAFEYNYGGLSR